MMSKQNKEADKHIKWLEVVLVVGGTLHSALLIVALYYLQRIVEKLAGG